MAFLICVLLFFFLRLCLAQLPEPFANFTIVQSQVNPAVKLSYKQNDLCETTAGVKSFSGYVHLPASTLADVGNYSINAFFWYFQARNNPESAPLTIYQAGGPGESSTGPALSGESGPCIVNIDSKSTTINPWSFNEHSNVLYIDQPVQAGFSYDTIVSATYSLKDDAVTPIKVGDTDTPPDNSTFSSGLYPNQNAAATANNSVTSATALWHFAEHWLSSFPEYRSKNANVSIWGNSYAGFVAPQTVLTFHDHLTTLPSGHPLQGRGLQMNTLGITNGCIDFLYQTPLYAEIAFNNTYDHQFISKTTYESAIQNFTKAGGCKELIEECREVATIGDPHFTGNNQTVNELCEGALADCVAYAIPGFVGIGGRNAFDLAQTLPEPCPYYVPARNFLNQASIQQQLGVPLNFSYDAPVVGPNFGLSATLSSGTGDPVRIAGVDTVSSILKAGIKVAMVFGDRDYRCNWVAGEEVTHKFSWPQSSKYATAGYEMVVDSAGKSLKAVTKQVGQLSFTRVFDAGHSVSAYAPETVYTVFQRTLQGMNVSTGKKIVDKRGSYATKGPGSSWGWKNKLPAKAPNTCMVNGKFQAKNAFDIGMIS